MTFKKLSTKTLHRDDLHEDLGKKLAIYASLMVLFSRDDYCVVGYLLDTGFHVFFWVGRNASQQIKVAGFARAKVQSMCGMKQTYFESECDRILTYSTTMQY